MHRTHIGIILAIAAWLSGCEQTFDQPFTTRPTSRRVVFDLHYLPSNEVEPFCRPRLRPEDRNAEFIFACEAPAQPANEGIPQVYVAAPQTFNGQATCSLGHEVHHVAGGAHN